MKRKALKRNIKIFGLFITIILFIYTFNITTGRYTGEISSAESIIAEPILTLSNNEKTISINDMIPRRAKNS